MLGLLVDGSVPVFPMYVGVILKTPIDVACFIRIPHVRGGDPFIRVKPLAFLPVFPMYVGVIPVTGCLYQGLSGIPHVRGGDPLLFPCKRALMLYSPCTWG